MAIFAACANAGLAWNMGSARSAVALWMNFRR
jgi:hypothetical protein